MSNNKAFLPYSRTTAVCHGLIFHRAVVSGVDNPQHVKIALRPFRRQDLAALINVHYLVSKNHYVMRSLRRPLRGGK